VRGFVQTLPALARLLATPDLGIEIAPLFGNYILPHSFLWIAGGKVHNLCWDGFGLNQYKYKQRSKIVPVGRWF